MYKLNNNGADNLTFNNNNVYLLKYDGKTVWQKSTIELSPSSCTFGELIAGYGKKSQTVTVKNISAFPTGQITVKRGKSYFQLNSGNNDSITLNSIERQDGTATFTVGPTSGLDAGTYEDTITVIDGNGMQATFDVSVIVLPQIWSIDVSPSYVNFSSCTVGYGSVSSYTLTVENTGNQPTGDITITRSPTNFSLSKSTTSSLGVGESATFSVTPPTGLGVGSYDVSVIVSAANVSGSITRNGSFTVNPQWSTVWSGSKTFTASGSFTLSGLNAGDRVQVTAKAEFEVCYLDSNDTPIYYSASSDNIYNRELSTSLYGDLAAIDISHSGNQIIFDFIEGEDYMKGSVFVGIPVSLTIYEVRKL